MSPTLPVSYRVRSVELVQLRWYQRQPDLSKVQRVRRQVLLSESNVLGLRIIPVNIETLAVHAGRSVDPSTGAVTPPIHLSTTFERSPNAQYPLGYEYSRETNPNRKALEECLAALEGGTEALCFGSGMAA